MNRSRSTAVKFGFFSLVMVMISGAVAFVLGQFTFVSTTGYSAQFSDASGLVAGSMVRVAGVPVGKIESVRVDDGSVSSTVDFAVDPNVLVLESTEATVRYQNLTGDRYLELMDAPGSTAVLNPGSTIPLERTTPALDLDALIGGFRPLLRSIQPDRVNVIASALLDILQGQGGTVENLLASIGTLTGSIADRDEVIGRVVENLEVVLGTIADRGDRFQGTVDELARLVEGLAADRDSIGSSIGSLDSSTATLTDLLVGVRPSAAGTVSELNRFAEQLDIARPTLELQLNNMPENYRKMARTGVYGSFFQFYLCEISIKFTGLDGEPVLAKLIGQYDGRCSA
ncbi:MAG: MCE family protein [Rhodococcus sp. (in: high G+C Gram-positive bacteria)]